MIEAGEFTADQAKMGYVGAFTYAEVISGYTSFYLGAKSVCPSVTMDVTFTGSWYDEALEKEAANKLIAGGCKLISQHADSMGAPTACETAGVPDVSYNGSTEAACPNTYLISSRIDWAPYYEYAIKAAMNGEAIDADWTGTLATGSVVLTDVNEKVAAKGTAERAAELLQLEQLAAELQARSEEMQAQLLRTPRIVGPRRMLRAYPKLRHGSKLRSLPTLREMLRRAEQENKDDNKNTK